jgi:uncharacterized protein
MKIHVLQVPPEGAHFEGEEPSGYLDLLGPDIEAISPVHYTLDAGLSGGGLFATGRLGVETRMQCVRCLETFSRRITVPDFAIQVELEGKESVDLTDYFREDILINLPANPRCDWNGASECQAKFQDTAVEESSGGRDIWGDLDRLKLK